MSRIAYDPIKDRMASFIRDKRVFRTLFYCILDVFFLRSWYIRRIIKKYANLTDDDKELKALDAGCGFGQYDRFILRKLPSINITALDVKDDYLQDCRNYFSHKIEQEKIRFQKQDLLSLNIRDTFHLAFCVDVLEHIAEDVRVMKNVQQSLKKGGYFVMHSPSIYSAKDAGEEESFVDEHARTGYSKEGLERKLHEAGLEPLEINYTYGPKGHFAWKLIIQYPMLWMNRWKLWILPVLAIYYLFTLPVSLILMKLDMLGHNKTGTGIYAVAVKK